MLSPSTSPSSPEGSLSELGASLLAAKTLCNLCSGCATNPLGTRLTTELEGRLVGGAPTPTSWRALPEASSMLSEWPQAASLLVGLLCRLQPADEPAGYDEDEYEESPLDDLVPIP